MNARLENMPESIFDGPARLHHQERGDCAQLTAQLTAQARKQGLREITRETELVITSESQYTCDGCRRTSGTIGELREHGISRPRSQRQTARTERGRGKTGKTGKTRGSGT